MVHYHQGLRNSIVPIPTMENRFFITKSGNEFKKIAETIRKIAKHYGLPMPTPCLHRKVIALYSSITINNPQRYEETKQPKLPNYNETI